MTGKPAAGVVSCRRGGAASTFDQTTNILPSTVCPSFPLSTGTRFMETAAEEVVKDEEGMQIMRTLGNNMAWLLKCIEAGKKGRDPVPGKGSTDPHKLHPLSKRIETQ